MFLRYQDINAGEVPEVTDDDGTRVRIVCGDFWGSASRSKAWPLTHATSTFGCRPGSARRWLSNSSGTPSPMCSKALGPCGRHQSLSASLPRRKSTATKLLCAKAPAIASGQPRSDPPPLFGQPTCAIGEGGWRGAADDDTACWCSARALGVERSRGVAACERWVD